MNATEYYVNINGKSIQLPQIKKISTKTNSVFCLEQT